MSDTPLSLAAEFDAPDEAQWRTLAQAALKGAPFERLTAHTEDGAPIAPLYRESDVATARDIAGLPGQAPFLRGAHAVRDHYLPWDIRAAYRNPNPAATNAEILEDLARGVSSIEIVVAGRSGGVAIANFQELARALDGVMLDLAPVALNTGPRGIEIGALLAEYLSSTSVTALKPAFNLDPLSAWAMNGAIPAGIDAAVQDAARFCADARVQFTDATMLRASARTVHESGGGPAQDLAFLIAAGVTYLRALEQAGVGPEDGASSLLFTVSVGPDVIVEIAKLRAARALWARIMDACGARPEHRCMRLHAITSRRMLTREDSWTNILRGTAACFAAGAGGADIVTVLPFTTPLGPASALARRLARNTQIILQEESYLGRVADPGGGAWSIEKLTQDLCEAAWTLFQGIEREGGLIAALRAGSVQAAIAKTSAATGADYARRKRAITGVSDFPSLGAAAPPLGVSAAHEPLPGAWGVDPIAPMVWARVSEPFERLRARAENKAGARVFAATLGPLAEFAACANFAKNLFAAGGVSLIGDESVHDGLAALIAAFKGAACSTAVLCGTDARYAQEAAAAATALKANGCDWVILAGKPLDEAALREAGVDQFIFAGQNALDAIDTLHAALGLSP
jgi:methylmalonyl-CoA mutase